MALAQDPLADAHYSEKTMVRYPYLFYTYIHISGTGVGPKINELYKIAHIKNVSTCHLVFYCYPGFIENSKILNYHVKHWTLSRSNPGAETIS